MSKNEMSKLKRAKFGSQLGVILATAGSAVGLGNVWRFPYMTGQNGGAVFIIIYVVCVLLLGIPCMISEFIVGRHGRANTARAYRKMAGGTPWAIIGYMGVLTGFLITGYYAVVAGWCGQYIWASLIGHMTGSPEYFKEYFVSLSSDPVKPVLWTVIMLGLTYLIIEKGVRDGIERASKVMMPTLFILLLVIVVASCMLPGAEKGIDFLFKPDFSKINSDVFLGALGQAFYSLSIAMGCLCTYASYFAKDTNLTKSASQIAIIDCLVAILAGLMIFPAAFAVGVNPDSGASLVFITLPNVFQQAFAGVPALGYIISLVFFALLTLAALTSLISLHEVSTAFLHEELVITRKKAAFIVTVTTIIIGTLVLAVAGCRRRTDGMGQDAVRLLRLRHRTGILAHRGIPDMYLYRLGGAASGGARRVHQLGNTAGTFLPLLHLPREVHLPPGHPVHLPAPVGTIKMRSVE